MREVRMTFGEHLEDLRKRMFFALGWLALAMGICFYFGNDLLAWALGPHKVAIRGAIRERSIVVLGQKGNDLLELSRNPPGPEGEPATGVNVWDELFVGDLRREDLVRELTLVFAGVLNAEQIETLVNVIFGATNPESRALGAQGLPARFHHLEAQLRQISKRIGSSVGGLLGGVSLDDSLEPLHKFNTFLDARREALKDSPPTTRVASAGISILVQKLEAIYDDMKKRALILVEDRGKDLVLIHPLEGFMTYFKVALVFGLFFSSPMILYELWKFVGAGLYHHEQRYVLIFMPFSLALFFAGVIFGYFSVIPVSLEFLASWGSEMAELSFTMANYIGLFFTMTVILGLVFQTPLIMIFLSKIDLVGPGGFRKWRKYMAFCSVLFAAIVTPPDPLSWSLVAGPMILLYELGIIIVSVGRKKKNRPAQNSEGSTA